MENLIQLQGGAKSYGARVLFEDVSFSINEGEHVGVIGPNGAGKTTLFKTLIGEETLDHGQIIRSRALRLGYLSQHDAWKPEETIESFLTNDELLPIWELKALGLGLGIREEDYARPIASLSGGYRMRVKLLHLLGEQPNLMLLDEPTNYLDLETLLVLEKFLQGFRGAFLLISHDREFLRRTTDHMLEIEGGEATKYNGGIDDYFEQKEMLRAQLAARAMSLAEKRKQILDFVARFGAKASKATQAQSRLKLLARMETIETKPLPVGARIRIPAPARSGKLVLSIDRASVGYGDRVILAGVDLKLAAGDHLAVVGLNGAGKSTLLKAIAGRLPPLQGSVVPGGLSTFAFFAQHVAEELNPADTVLKSLQRRADPSVLPQEILDLAGSLLFSGDAVQKPVRVLSGGERSRVALGQVLLQRASCLILDEPTNHLDFQTVEALTQALHSYTGSLVVVSHDRGFIRRIGTKILEVNHGRASVYPGTYDDYVWSLEKGAYATLHTEGKPAARAEKAPRAAARPPSAGEGESAAAKERYKENYKEKKKALDRRFRQLETRIAELDKKLAVNHERLAALNHLLTTDASATGAKNIQEMGKLQHEIDAWEQEWMAAADEKQAVEREIASLVEGGRTEDST